MIESKLKPSDDQTHEQASRSVVWRGADDRNFPRQLDRLAPWLRGIRLLRGPLFWMSIAFICVSLFVVGLISVRGWVLGDLGRIAVGAWIIFFWAAMMTAFAGWILRSEE